MPEDVGGVVGEERPVPLHRIRELKEREVVLVVSAEERPVKAVPLGKECGGLSRVAGLSGRLHPMGAVGKARDGLVQRLVLLREVVVVLPVGVEVLELLLVDGDLDCDAVPLHGNKAAVPARNKLPRDDILRDLLRPCKEEELLPLRAVKGPVPVCLRLEDSKRCLKELRHEEKGRQKDEALHIRPVVGKEPVPQLLLGL